MKKLRARIACVVMAGALCVTGFTGCGKEAAVDGTAEAVKFDDTSVNMGVANFFLRYQQATTLSYYSMFGMDTSGVFNEKGDDGKTYGETTKSGSLDSLEEMYLLKAHMAEYNITLTDEEKAAADKAAEEFISANSEELLTKIGATKEDVSEVLQLYAIKSKIYDPMVVDTDTNVTDDEAAQTTITYVKLSTEGTETDADGNKVALTDEEKAAKKAQAEQIIEAVEATGDVANADMDAIAKGVDSTLTASAVSYGSDDTNMEDNVKKAAAELTDGQLSGSVVESDTAYFVVRLDKAFDQEKTEAKKTEIVNSRKQDTYDGIVKEWKDAAKVTTTKAWDKLTVTDSDVYTFKQADTSSTSAE
ncbi:MAG: peptidyl-prolyl cis-trans isomerase [Lachnospiraceae bacterium]|nr:peptidyl-prolyl cis-trans isomerase [Lachnospiraceae bacterium]